MYYVIRIYMVNTVHGSIEPSKHYRLCKQHSEV